MLIRPGIVRRIVIVVAILLVSGAAAAMKLTSWTPANMCFCPTPDRPDPVKESDSAMAVLGTSSGLSLPSSADSASHSDIATLGAAASAGVAERSRGNAAQGGGKSSGAGWGRNRSHRRESGATESYAGPSASLGGLWKMMSLTARSPEARATAVTARAATPRPAREPRAPKEPRSPSTTTPSQPAPAPPSGAISATPVSEETPVPPAGSSFGEDTTPVAELAGGAPAPSNPGSLGTPGSAGRAKGADAGSLSANPEPGSLALLATGLLGIAGLIRRRRT